MKTSRPILLLMLLILIGACRNTETPVTDPTAADTTAAQTPQTQALPPKPDCNLPGEVLEGNSLWVPTKSVLVRITADSTTRDPELGDSHRILEVYSGPECRLVKREVLPVNVSADFPYYLAEINYNNANQLVGIRGFDKIYCYDIDKAELLPPLEPQFKHTRPGADAQSGMIQRLEVWEDYLIGFAQDEGVFAFDLHRNGQPQPVLPFAEYKVSESEYTSLFLFNSNDSLQQVAMPTYDPDTDEFKINPFLEKPTAIETNISNSARNNRFLVLRAANEDKAVVLVDMRSGQRVVMPQAVAAEPTQKILDWVKSVNR